MFAHDENTPMPTLAKAQANRMASPVPDKASLKTLRSTEMPTGTHTTRRNTEVQPLREQMRRAALKRKADQTDDAPRTKSFVVGPPPAKKMRFSPLSMVLRLLSAPWRLLRSSLGRSASEQEQEAKEKNLQLQAEPRRSLTGFSSGAARRGMDFFEEVNVRNLEDCNADE
eukprot:TRINITY_DN11947_c0_g1_i1.p2 TRINITY_DN11947_c0_g1~~TRINITY_DN11947_c0_g1_i1.p2  ORF type:complete len:170 (-),score=48.70 TRINITY_DN11947_c0_g1_i1:347-856(-)